MSELSKLQKRVNELNQQVNNLDNNSNNNNEMNNTVFNINVYETIHKELSINEGILNEISNVLIVKVDKLINKADEKDVITGQPRYGNEKKKVIFQLKVQFISSSLSSLSSLSSSLSSLSLSSLSSSSSSSSLLSSS